MIDLSHPERGRTRGRRGADGDVLALARRVCVVAVGVGLGGDAHLRWVVRGMRGWMRG